MKKIFLIFFIFLLHHTSYAQNKNRTSVSLSFNKVEAAYRYRFSEKQIWVSSYLGVSNQDINSNFDDFLLGIKIGLPILELQKAFFYGQLNSGLYFPNNNYYNITTSFIGLDLGYEIQLGKTKKHSIFAEIGYLYGKREYKQKYDDRYISISSTETFILLPLIFNTGYGFNF